MEAMLCYVLRYVCVLDVGACCKCCEQKRCSVKWCVYMPCAVPCAVLCCVLCCLQRPQHTPTARARALGSFPPRAVKRAGALRYSTISSNSLLASSTPFTSAKLG
jgi:hypothetical protein